MCGCVGVGVGGWFVCVFACFFLLAQFGFLLILFCFVFSHTPQHWEQKLHVCAYRGGGE